MRGGVTWGSPSYVPVIAAAAAACAVVAVAAYQPQLRRAGRLWRWCVPGFRVAALAALLGSVLRPSVWRPIAPGDLGEVVVVLDDSPGMGVADSSWTPTELVGMAEAVHAMPPGVARWNGDELRRQVARLRPLIDEAARAAGEAEYARVAGRSAEAPASRAGKTRAALVAAATALAARATSVAEPLKASLARWSDVAALLDGKRQSAWAELRGRVDSTNKAIEANQVDADAKLYREDARVRPACDALARLSRIDLSRRVVTAALVPDLPPGVPVRVVQGRDDPGRTGHARSVVLFTDGRGEVAPASSLGVPVIVCRPTPATVRDVAIERIALPAIAYVGQPATAHVELRALGYAGTPVALTVRVDDTVTKADAKLDARGASLDVPVQFDRAGRSEVTFAVTPLDGEATPLNNTTDRYVRVTAARVEAMAFASGDLPSLAAVLSRVPGLSAKLVAADGAAAVDAASIAKQRVIILDDVSAGAMTGEQLDAVRESVVDRGGTLVLVAGRSHWPLDAESEALLDEYLPYRVAGGPVWRTGSGRPAKGDSDDVALAAVGRYLQLGELRDGVRVLLAEPETGAPLVTESSVGHGRVLTVAADDVTGRTSPADATRFWDGLIRRAAAVPYAVEQEGYALDTDRADAGPGDVVNVRVKVPAGRAAARDPSLLVTAGNQVVRSEPVVADGPAPDGKFSAALANLPPGDYVIRLDTGVDDELAPVMELPLRVRSRVEEELADVSADALSLARLGEVVPIADAGRLAAEATRVRGDRPVATEYALWDSPYLFLFVTACLTTEWALRKRLGLA